MKNSRGVVYVAWGSCIAEAEKSAASAKKAGLKTCLIAEKYSGSAFDEFILASGKLETTADKVSFYELSPFEETLYLDADTQILADLSYGFEMASQFGIALSIAPACVLKILWSQFRDFGMGDFHDDTVQYNAGVIFFNKKHQATQGFWKLVKDKLKWVSSEKRPCLLDDQFAMNLVLCEKRINPFVLPTNWNFRPGVYMERGLPVPSGFGPLKIWHSRQPVPSELDSLANGFWKFQ